MVNLEGRAAIVTGGSRGIGLAIARAIVEAGGRVAIGARKRADVEAAAAQLNQQSGRSDAALGVVCDVRDAAACRQLVAATADAFGRIDILVNNAGVGTFRPVADMTIELWDSIIETNLSGTFYCTHAAIPHLRQAGSAWIINIGSLAGKNAFPGGSAYNASKFGLIGFSEALMQDVRYDDIRVSYIMPGSVATEFGGSTTASGDDWRIAPEDVAQVVLDLLAFPERSLPSRIELRPSRPPRR